VAIAQTNLTIIIPALDKLLDVSSGGARTYDRNVKSEMLVEIQGAIATLFVTALVLVSLAVS
jgi:hypothetical protein